MHKFEQDFYGSELRVLICGYIRPEKNFSSLGEASMITVTVMRLSHAQYSVSQKEVAPALAPSQLSSDTSSLSLTLVDSVWRCQSWNGSNVTRQWDFQGNSAIKFLHKMDFSLRWPACKEAILRWKSISSTCYEML